MNLTNYVYHYDIKDTLVGFGFVIIFICCIFCCCLNNKGTSKI